MLLIIISSLISKFQIYIHLLSLVNEILFHFNFLYYFMKYNLLENLLKFVISFHEIFERYYRTLL